MPYVIVPLRLRDDSDNSHVHRRPPSCAPGAVASPGRRGFSLSEGRLSRTNMLSREDAVITCCTCDALKAGRSPILAASIGCRTPEPAAVRRLGPPPNPWASTCPCCESRGQQRGPV